MSKYPRTDEQPPRPKLNPQLVEVVKDVLREYPTKGNLSDEMFSDDLKLLVAQHGTGYPRG